MKIDDLKTLFINEVLANKLMVLYKSGIYGYNLYNYYRGLASIILNIDKPSIYKTSLLMDRYIRSIEFVKKYYEMMIAKYIDIHPFLVKSLRDEINILLIQGAESLLSRILFLIASMNHVIDIEADVGKYVANLNNILSIPVPPRAGDAKAIDLVKPGDNVCILIGDIQSLWAWSVFLNELFRNEANPIIHVCDEQYGLNTTISYLRRFLPMDMRKNPEVINSHECVLSLNMLNDCDYILVANKLAIYSVIDNIDKKYPYNILLLLNPVNTTLGVLTGSTPIVINIMDFKNILFRDEEH